jgi:heptosyltransferase III
MSRAVAFVGHDSGPMHLAAAVGVRCVGMFGNFNRPKWWHPYGAQHRIIHDMRGVLAITPSEVFAALNSIVSLQT